MQYLYVVSVTECNYTLIQADGGPTSTRGGTSDSSSNQATISGSGMFSISISHFPSLSVWM